MNARSGSFATNNRGLNANPHVGAMPSRGYATQSIRTNGSVNRSYGANAQRGGYGVSSQHYGSAGYSHYAGNGGRSTTYARSNVASHNAAPAAHSSGGGGRSGGGGESHHH